MGHETNVFTRFVINSLLTSLRPQKNGGGGTIIITIIKLILNIKHYDIPGDSPKNHLLTYLWQDYNNLCHDPLWNQEALCVWNSKQTFPIFAARLVNLKSAQW